MEKAEILFESYNMAVEESFNKIFTENKSHDLLNIEDENIKQHLAADLEKWANTPIGELDGISPAVYFKNMEDIAQLLELFRLASKLCDNDIPDPLTDRLKAFNENAVNGLLELISDESILYNDEDQIISLMAIRTIGKWKAASSLEPLIKLLDSIREDSEIVVEEICGALVQLGENSANRIIEILNESTINNLEEYLLDSLVKIGITIKDRNLYDLIFRTIKSTFNKMENKLFGAICLGNFGDGRAIPALRGFVEKNKNTIDYETFLEIKSSVHRLGGNMDDIEIRF
ncbi:MAG: hypothetical protein BWY74_04287 [Firmicutes bacterium ADurb.Bin419]|nr:MAG: hypothetical protein BWY74_04287 [Firmicutes bacterium ADurb.Bin419]